MNAEAEGRAAAERFRRKHHLGIQPLGDLVAIIEQTTGIDVAVLDVGPDEHGMAMRDPRRNAVFIGVARTRHPMRQRSTLAHELGHVLFEDWADSDRRNWSDQTPEERRCRAFVRHLLVPVDGLRAFLGDREEVTLATLAAVVQRFLVSPAIAAIALEQAGYIDTRTRHEWGILSTPQLAVRFGWSDHYHALQAESDQLRAPQRLLARAITGYVEGVLSAQAIATLRGITLREVEAELREAGIEPVDRPVAWTDASELPNADVDLAALDEDLNAPESDTQDAAGGRGSG
jgi:Zn-dependent peptidase ImmA (M78 family)